MKKNPFTLVQQDQHQTRPWWSALPDPIVGLGWEIITRRDDGYEMRLDEIEFIRSGYEVEEKKKWIEAVEKRMAEIDRESPLPEPPPFCGQVWCINGNYHQVVSVINGLAVFIGEENVSILRNAYKRVLGPTFYPPPTWPPKNGVLVSGPLSPWAPPGWSLED